MRIPIDSPLFCHSFLPTFKAFFPAKWIGICFSLTKCASPHWESPLRAMALTLEGMKLAFAFWWSWPVSVRIPRGATELTAWFGKYLHLAAVLSEWKNHIQWDCSYVRPFYMWDHWFISVCGLEVLCNHTSSWGFAVKTLQTEKVIRTYTAQTLTFFLNGEYFEFFCFPFCSPVKLMFHN